MSEKQRTIAKPISVCGKGLHTGQDVEMTFLPASVNYGYKFQRVDLDERPIIDARVENVVDTSRSTVIGDKGVRIGTVEHVLSALYGLGIDNVLIEINAPETPIMDGSARFFTEKLLEAGSQEQDAEREYIEIKENICYENKETGTELIVYPDTKFSLNVMIDYDSEVLGQQYAYLDNLDKYAKEISMCRTFVFLRELEPLLQNNLIKGGDLDNAIVIVERELPQNEVDRIADLFNQPHVEVRSQGILNNVDLRFSNEPARHKLLDLLGDLALVGKRIKGRVLATRSGHNANVEFSKKIRQELKRRNRPNVRPDIDLNSTPLYNINQIRNILPHRPPFLLVDKIFQMEKEMVIGAKNITMNETFFVGHFPEEPVMPGVLIAESMAQVGGILVLDTVPDPENYLTFFMKIDKLKFRKKVVPGDTLVIKMELLSPIRRGIANMRGYAFVGDSVVTEGEFMAQISKIKNK